MDLYNGPGASQNYSDLSKFRIQGLVAATFTPFTDYGEVNTDIIPDYADFLVNNEIKNIFVNGSSGEWPSLTLEERERVTECWMWVASRFEHVIVHVGSECLKDAIHLAEQAESLGADAISSIAPSYFKMNTPEDLVNFIQPIAAAAPNTPFYYYHIPQITGLTVSMVEFMKTASRVIPTFRGIKFSSADLKEGMECVNFQNKRFNLLFGVDQHLLGALASGFDGAIGTTYNYGGRIYKNIIDKLDTGSQNGQVLADCQKFQTYANDILTVAMKYGKGHNLSGMKEAFRILGPDVGPTRSPLRPLSDSERMGLRRELQALKGVSYINSTF